jgi:uncharacterized protein YoxC
MNTSDPQFWMMIASWVIAVCFFVMAIALIVIAFLVKKAVNTVSRVEERIEPMFSKVNAIGEQGKEIAVQFNQLSGHLSVATKHFSESAGLIKEEVAELKQLVGMTAHEAKDKVALVSKTIDRTQMQVTTTADFIQEKIVEPAVEVAAVMAGVKRGLQVLFAPTPKRIDRVFTDDEMFIG